MIFAVVIICIAMMWVGDDGCDGEGDFGVDDCSEYDY